MIASPQLYQRRVNVANKPFGTEPKPREAAPNGIRECDVPSYLDSCINKPQNENVTLRLRPTLGRATVFLSRPKSLVIVNRQTPNKKRHTADPNRETEERFTLELIEVVEVTVHGGGRSRFPQR